MACLAVQTKMISNEASKFGSIVDDAATNPNRGALLEPIGMLKGPLVWSGADFENDKSFTLYLSDEDIEEIHTALEIFKTYGLDGDEVAPGNFPLPNLASRLADCAMEVHQGRGFFLLKGLDKSDYSVEDSVTIYLGISNYIADKRGSQDRSGNMLTHITNSKLWKVPMEQRHGIHSNSALPYHNDMGCDILALQARDSAHDGGHTYLSSAWTTFNKLLSEDPSVAAALLTPNWPVQISGGSFYLAPAFEMYEGKLMASMDPNRFGPHPSRETPGIPGLTLSQKHALERISKVAKQSELRLKLESGDILFFNNWALLHRRDAYNDNDHTSRHLVRLWLRNSKLGWPIPPSLLLPWHAAFRERGKNQKRLYSLFPIPEYQVPKYTAGSAAFILESDESDIE